MPKDRPFPPAWLEKYDTEQLERLAIMTVDGKLTDAQAECLLSHLPNQGRQLPIKSNEDLSNV
jgi:hypothetical protein